MSFRGEIDVCACERRTGYEKQGLCEKPFREVWRQSWVELGHFRTDTKTIVCMSEFKTRLELVNRRMST